MSIKNKKKLILHTNTFLKKFYFDLYKIQFFYLSLKYFWLTSSPPKMNASMICNASTFC